MTNDILDNMNMAELGAELKKAREQRGLKQQDAADMIGVARTTIVAIEKGDRRIKSSELIKLARAYGRSVSDFVRQERPQSTPFAPQFRSTIDAEAINELEELARNYVELERITNTPMPLNYPPADRYKFIGSRIEQIAENVAIQERIRLGLGDGPIPILRNVLEQEVGLRIFYLELKSSAVYIFDNELGGCLAVNSLLSVEQRRWSLSHEYAHFLVHRYTPDRLDESVYQRLPERERFADAFARYFLMPTSSLIRLIGTRNIKKTDLFIFANYFGVSVAAITRRLEDMKFIPAGIRLREDVVQQPIPDQEDKLPARYRYLAIEAFENELITEGQLARFLQVDRIEARELVESLKALTYGE